MDLIHYVQKIETENMESNLVKQKSSSIDDITLSQIAESMENEYYIFEGIHDLSISQTIETYGAINFDMELDFDMELLGRRFSYLAF